MRNILIILGLITLTGCTTGVTTKSDDLGDHQQATKTTYFMGIPIFEEEYSKTTSLPK